MNGHEGTGIGDGTGPLEVHRAATLSAALRRPRAGVPSEATGHTLQEIAGATSLPSLRALERQHIFRVLAAVHGSVGRAARILGISRWALGRRLRKLGIAARQARRAGGSA